MEKPLNQFRGVVHRMELGKADLVLTTVASAKMASLAVFELTPDQAKQFKPGDTVVIQLSSL